MMKYCRLIGAFTFALLSSAGCMKETDDFQNDMQQKDSDAVCFSVTGDVVQTKTVYGEQNPSDGSWQINWVEGDSFDIYSPQTAGGNRMAVYNVSGNTVAPSIADEFLKWGDKSQEHDFYAVYPSGTAIPDMEKETVLFDYDFVQSCVIENGAGTDIEAEPDMNSAYMVASNTGVMPQAEAVTMAFKPVMTTLKVKVPAPEEGSVKFTGISVLACIPSSIAETKTFEYDLVNNAVVYDNSERKVKTGTFIGVTCGEENYIELKAGQSVTMTAFLPPVKLDSLAIRVHTVGKSEYTAYIGSDAPENSADIAADPSVVIAAGSIRKVVLSSHPYAEDGNNWMTPLDDDIYITDLSIPGTHDSGTGEEQDGMASDDEMMPGCPQIVSIAEQLKMGIRCFDLRPGQYNTEEGEFLRIYHGYLRYKMSFHEAAGTITDYLIENPGEFAIIIMRHESDCDDVEDQGAWGRLMREALDQSRTHTFTKDGRTVSQTYCIQDKVVKYHPDLTIGDMRGKIILISRQDYDYGGNGPDGKCNSYSGDPKMAANQITSAVFNSARYFVQDYYGYSEDPDPKIKVVQSTILNASKSKSNALYLNHCSAYRGTYDDRGYRRNSEAVNPKTYEFISSGNSFSGSTGILMIDFAGIYEVDGMKLYGDLLPQSIIDNNYKYCHRRK